MTHFLGVDIGGSGIKAAIVDTQSGKLLTERHRLETPQPSTPKNMAKTVKKLLKSFDYDGPVGCCFPAVIQQGKAKTAGNIDDKWLDTQVGDVFSDATGHQFTVLNDADAAAVAEMELGAGVDLDGLVLMITIGTGIGSGMYYAGKLVPNLEIGWMPSDKDQPMERYASDSARKRHDLSWDEWGKRFNYFLKKTHRVFMPDHFILGGGASKKLDKFEHRITLDTPIHIARFRNNSGIIGAAISAANLAAPYPSSSNRC